MMQLKLRNVYAVLGRHAPFSALWEAGITFIRLEANIQPLQIEYVLHTEHEGKSITQQRRFHLMDLDPVQAYAIRRFNDYLFEDPSPDPSSTFAVLDQDGVTRTMF